VEVEAAPETKVAFDFSNAEFDDPLLCVYCAHQTSEDDKQCPHCKRSLYHRFYEREQPRWLWVAWTVTMAEAIFMVGGVLVLLAILTSALSVAQYGGRTIDVGQVLAMYFGQKNALAPQAQTAILSALPQAQFYLRLAYVIFAVLVAFGLLTRKRLFYILYVVTLVIAALLLYLSSTIERTFVAGGGAATPLEGILQVALNETLGMFIMLSSGVFGLLLVFKIMLAFAINDDFETRTERLWCVIDKTVREPNGAFIRAKTYMKREMWTLAVLYLQRAVSMQPSTVEYYLALAESYAHIGRYENSLHLLDDAQQLQPGSPVIPNLRGVILQLQARAAASSTGGL
jgi:tetratricopeptide (TPR) repeat protein